MIAGTHPSVNETTQKLVKHAKVLHIEAQIEQFHSVESLGVSCLPKCGGCRCGKCQAGGKDMTLLEEKEYEMIKNGLNPLLPTVRSGRTRTKSILGPN